MGLSPISGRLAESQSALKTGALASHAAYRAYSREFIAAGGHTQPSRVQAVALHFRSNDVCSFLIYTILHHISQQARRAVPAVASVVRTYATAKPGKHIRTFCNALRKQSGGSHCTQPSPSLPFFTHCTAASEVSSILEQRISGAAAGGDVQETGRVLSESPRAIFVP